LIAGFAFGGVSGGGGVREAGSGKYAAFAGRVLSPSSAVERRFEACERGKVLLRAISLALNVRNA